MPAPDHRRRLTAFVVAMAVLIATPLAVVAADAFTDVPNSNVHHDDITWLADADVTRGCNPPANDRFCPGDSVTRQQMASFLRRLAENRVVDAATAIEAEHAAQSDNAGNLDGTPPSGYLSVVAASVGSHAHGTALGTIGAGSPFEATSVAIDVPHDGVLILRGSTGWELGDTWLTQWLEINQSTACDSWNSTDRIPGSGTEESADSRGASLNSDGIVEVSAGTHTISLCLWPFSSTASSLNVSFSLIANYIPTSASSISTLGLSSAQDAPSGGPSNP